jgi:chemotaxis protein CheC
VLGNVMRVHVTFSVPWLHLDSLGHFLNSITSGDDGLRRAMLITASFKVAPQEIDGRIVIVLSVSSLERLVQAVAQWDANQSLA